jgi:hypothetical protein
MGTDHALSESVPQFAPSVYEYVGNQVTRLIPAFGLQSVQTQIMQTYKEICEQSLAFPLGQTPPPYSRINHDGTPFQFAVTPGSALHPLQFLSEAGMSGLSGTERMRVNRECLASVAESLQAREALRAVEGLLDGWATCTDPDLSAEPGGAFWIGVAFMSAQEPQLKIYANAAWGDEGQRWTRLSRFASYFGAHAPWATLVPRLAADMKPLGAAVTLARERPPTGRIYLSVYGKRFAYYEELAKSVSGERFQRVLRQYALGLLGDEYPYPTQTAVCSFGLGPGAELDFKVELCGHCLFASDAEAAAKLRAWFAAACVDPTDYLNVLTVLSEGRLSSRAPDLHCYVGAGMKEGTIGFSVYLKPRLLATDEP